jgi:hypothetical protein
MDRRHVALGSLAAAWVLWLAAIVTLQLWLFLVGVVAYAGAFAVKGRPGWRRMARPPWIAYPILTIAGLLVVGGLVSMAGWGAPGRGRGISVDGGADAVAVLVVLALMAIVAFTAYAAYRAVPEHAPRWKRRAAPGAFVVLVVLFYSGVGLAGSLADEPDPYDPASTDAHAAAVQFYNQVFWVSLTVPPIFAAALPYVGRDGSNARGGPPGTAPADA